MKFVAIATVALATFFASSTRACNPECRQNVSSLFAEKYGPVVDCVFGNLSTKLVTGLPPKTANATTNEVLACATTFKLKLLDLVFRAIFKDHYGDTPRFLRPCVYPENVKQPPLPPHPQWTWDDCKNMNYICGNPPSICHFFSIVKENNIKRIITTLTSDSGSNGYITKGIKAVVKKAGGSSANAVKIINQWRSSDVKSFCSNATCDAWDYEIQTRLLEFP